MEQCRSVFLFSNTEITAADNNIFSVLENFHSVRLTAAADLRKTREKQTEEEGVGGKGLRIAMEER